MMHTIRILIWTIGFSLMANVSMAQNLPGSGNATTDFNPGYVEIEDFPRVEFPITLTAWVRLEPFNPPPSIARFPIFSTGQGTGTAYRGLSFQMVRQGSIPYLEVQWGNGACLALNCVRTFRAFVNVNVVNADQMIHVAAVIHSVNQVQFYLNGQLVNSFQQGNPSILQPAYSPAIETNFARIGSHQAGGTDFFDGSIDEITIWDTARTLNQIREFMCKKVPPASNNLLAYYKLDEINATDTVVDSSPNNYFGLPVGTLTKEFSGAAIGDESDFNYPANTGVLHINSLGDTVHVTRPGVLAIVGAHAYTVFAEPNHKNGIGADSTCMRDRYYGVFLAHIMRPPPSFPNPNPNYQIMDVSIRGNTPPPFFGVYIRGRNNVPTWQLQAGPNAQGNEITNLVPIRREFYPRIEDFDYDPDLPDTVITCNFPLLLSAAPLDVGSLSWNDSLNTTGRELSVLKPGNYTITATSPCSTGTITQTITVLPDIVEADTNFSFCEGDSVAFLDTVFREEGQFVITSTSPLCDTIWEVNIVFSNQTIPRDTSVSLCAGETFAGGGSVFTEAGNFTYIEPNPDGCDFEYSLEIIRLSDPEIFIDTDDEELCDGEELTLTVENHEDYPILWSTGETTKSITILTGGDYSVQVGGQCGLRHDTIFIFQSNCRPKLYIPNAFAPTGTGRNERFEVKGDGIRIYEISIYDRWGNKIYHSTDLNESWDGTYNGQLVPSAVYVYVIIATGFETPEVVRERGTVYLLR
ncbi:MAG: gliding motility-associated C-terminal domain-containing protein [Cryomorphaceae bacterium]|nr:gliding motility-associated C-terminal domain-containing protein [Cryomorphaceae bacterium]